jgi:MerR family transcriptional regulator/heat shock protein HspR
MIERQSRGVYVISVAAELAGVHPQTLRIYERKGLLDPARTAGGNRRYSESDLARLRRIAELTEEGLNLAGVRRVLELEAELGRLQAEVERARRDAYDRVAETERRHRRDLVPVSQAMALWKRPAL